MKKVGIIIFVFFGVFVNGKAQSPMAYRNGMVVSAHPESSQVGVDILKKGGNAIEAGVFDGYESEETRLNRWESECN